jgi:hypothetical protein
VAHRPAEFKKCMLFLNQGFHKCFDPPYEAIGVCFVLSHVLKFRYRGYIWRKELRKLNRCALKLQCRLRILRAKRLVREERNRRSHGAEVVDMTADGAISCNVDDVFFTLKV